MGPVNFHYKLSHKFRQQRYHIVAIDDNSPINRLPAKHRPAPPRSPHHAALGSIRDGGHERVTGLVAGCLFICH